MDQAQREALIDANRREYGDAYAHMRWITPEEARAAAEERERLVSSVSRAASWGCGGTKADCRDLSPGCRACGEGVWSCLFVNGVCNARCYYCPSEQREVGEPGTNSLTFGDPAMYAAYLRRFGFRGASMSGGEPLLTFDRTLGFLEHARAALGPDGHLWMYTNGILLTAGKLERLVGTGLDEIRIDLTATDYDLAPVDLAASRVRTVTVEIPALPEDADRLLALLPRLAAAGVRHLNLHELRATPHNLPRLIRRGHVFRHGGRVTVLGSEILALRAMDAALGKGIPLPVNYCSSVYKHLYQGRAARSRAAEAARDPHESVTEAGYIRELEVRGGGTELEAAARALRSAGAPESLWRLDARAGRLVFHPDFAGQVPGRVFARYHAASLRQAPTYQAAFREVELEAGKGLVVERQPVGEAEPYDSSVAGVAEHERLPSGLVPYF